jgi:parallel beta-helix repeat protein
LKKTVSGIVLSLLIISTLALAFNIEIAKEDQEPQILLETDKDTYILGENITIVLVNIGIKNVRIGGYPAWQICTYPEEQPVYPAIFAFLAWSLNPEENDTFIWNQYNQFNETFCSSGTYVVKDTQGWGLSAYFKIISANVTVPDDYPTIQEAINNASSGDIIYVRAGTYHENVVVNKSVTLVGEEISSTIVDGEKYGSSPVVAVMADNVTIARFTIQNSTYYPDVSILDCNHVQILNNSLRSATYKILLEDSENCIIKGNEIFGGEKGITLVNSNNNKIANNTVLRCNSYTFPIGPFYGISLEESAMNSIENNVISESDIGIGLSNSNSNRICNNTISGNWPTSHPAYDAEKGIKLTSNSNNNHIIANEVSNMTQTAIILTQSSGIIYHNNFINNTNQVGLTDSLSNVWNDDYPSGGNYWSDYNGTDFYSSPYQNVTGSDGIGDSAYFIDENNTDNCPLTKPYAGPHDIGLKVSFSKTIVPEGFNTTLTINVTIINYGLQTETFNFTVQMPTLNQSQEITLESRNSTTITFTWNTTGFTKGNYNMLARAESVPDEKDVSDNILGCWAILTIPGDTNGDSTVNFLDAILLGVAFGSEPDDPNWNPNSDINGDHVVNFLDAIILGAHLGQSW